MKDKLKAIEYKLATLSKRINKLNYDEVNYSVEEALKVISNLIYELSDAIETIEIICEDHHLSKSRNNKEDRNAN